MSKLISNSSSIFQSLFQKNYTLNTDGSCKLYNNKQPPKYGTGCIIRDDEGNLYIAASYNLSEKYYNTYCDVALVEAEALKNGLQLARDHNIRIKVVKVDNKEVLDYVLGRTTPIPNKHVLRGNIQEIKSIREDWIFEIKQINREENKVADMLANLGTDLRGMSKIYTPSSRDLPLRVAEQIDKEKVDDDDQEESRSVMGNMGMAGAIAGVALLGYSMSKLFSGEGSSSNVNQESNNKNFNVPKSPIIPSYHNTLHFSGSDINQKGQGGAGFIIRDQQGDFIVAGSYNLDVMYPDCHIAIENATALRNGLKWVNSSDDGIYINRILGNNREVVERVNGIGRPPRVEELSDLINEIGGLLFDEGIPVDRVEFMGERANNGVAHELAAVGVTLKHDRVYRRVVELPPKVRELFQRDKMGLF